MGCKGCGSKRNAFRRLIMRKKRKNKLSEQEIEHFMKVCPHGVPNGFMCNSCKKIIEIPADAVIKPEKPKEK